MENKNKNPFILITFTIFIYGIVMNLNKVIEFIGLAINFCMPIIIGGVLAFMLNVPMKALEKHIKKLLDKVNLSGYSRIVSLILTMLLIAMILGLAVTMVIPEIVTSVKTITPLIKEKWPELVEFMRQYKIDLSQVDLEGLLPDVNKLFDGTGSLVGSVFKVASSTLSVVINFCFGIVIMIYTLMSKDMLKRQFKRITYANLGVEKASKICYLGRLMCNTYTKFLSGQCIEAVILGVLIYVAFKIFSIPYAGLIGFLTGVLAFIPYVGAFTSCAIGALLVLLVDPSKVILELIVYELVQFIENQFIYPHVVGNSVGIPPLGIVISVLTGAKLLGIVGIIFFIPLMAVICALINEDTNRKLEERHINEIA